MMPDINGWDIHKKLKSTNKKSKIPIIFISSVADDTSKITAKSIGDDFIEKPFDSYDLKQKIENILNG